MNFSELAIFQKKLRSEADGYAMFIELEAINDEEAYKLFDWYMENSLDVDRDGRIRMKLLKRLSLDFIRDSLQRRPGGRKRVVPEMLKNKINKVFNSRNFNKGNCLEM